MVRQLFKVPSSGGGLWQGNRQVLIQGSCGDMLRAQTQGTYNVGLVDGERQLVTEPSPSESRAFQRSDSSGALRHIAVP